MSLATRNIEPLISELHDIGMSESMARRQLALLLKGPAYIHLDRCASVSDGISVLDSSDKSRLVELYERESQELDIVKFVPASGAASRMFKSLLADWKSGNISDDTLSLLKKRHLIPIFDDIDDRAEPIEILDHLFSHHKMNLGSAPKGTIPFHRYGQGTRTAFEEHLVEGASYCRKGDDVKIHFTISKEYKEEVKMKMDSLIEHYGKTLGCKFQIEYSVQAPSTDTIALKGDYSVLRWEEGGIVLRPGGHGSLLQNLNGIEADIIFIKNIDNVVPDGLKEDTIKYKKALGGILIETQKQAREILAQLESETEVTEEMVDFLRLCGTSFEGRTMSKDEYVSLLNRPYRVCGMVKNEGEPGGGPFWVDEIGGSSLQIVESAQVDHNEEGQHSLFKAGTHFNPVDIICSTRNLSGNKLDLSKFRNDELAFVTNKSFRGEEIKALEWPGLWNGSMAYWNTIFVEVPISTFNPVKTIFDLLRPAHQ